MIYYHYVIVNKNNNLDVLEDSRRFHMDDNATSFNGWTSKHVAELEGWRRLREEISNGLYDPNCWDVKVISSSTEKAVTTYNNAVVESKVFVIVDAEGNIIPTSVKSDELSCIEGWAGTFDWKTHWVKLGYSCQPAKIIIEK